MKINVTTKLGNNSMTIQIDEQDELLALQKAITLGNPPQKCTACGNQDIVYESNKSKSGKFYVRARCQSQNCRATALLGHYDPQGFFWRDFERYNPNENQQQNSNQGQPQRTQNQYNQNSQQQMDVGQSQRGVDDLPF